MIRLVCPIPLCGTTWFLHPEEIDERIRDVAAHYAREGDHPDDLERAERRVREHNSEEIRKAYDDLGNG